MSLLTIAQAVALNVGMPRPTQVIAAAGREWSELVQMANETGEELTRRVQWGALTRSAETTGGQLPADFDRLVDGVCVGAAGGIVRPLTRAEWSTLPDATGTPRYFLLEDDRLSLWPEGAATVIYQSKAWTTGGIGFSADDQEALIDEALFAKALIVRWRRQKGMPYADEEAELEAALTQYARNDNRGRL